MIRFYDDWKDYPNAVVHLETSNKSALEMSAKLRDQGIKNHAFFLSLLDPRLKNVDPFDPNLTQAQMVLVAIECKNNPWYLFREIARAPAIAGIGGSKVEFNRSNLCLWWCFICHVTIILTQPRQTGKSFCTDLLMTWLFNFACNSTQINLMTKDDKLRAENIKRLKDIYDELPKYLQLKTREDVNNTEELSVKRLGNTYKTHVPQPSTKRAYNLGRGMTTPIFHIDEGPFQVNIELALPAALSSMGAAIDAAKRNEAPYGIVYTTTAGKKDDKDGKYFYSLIQKSALWSEKFYDAANEQELHMLVMRNSRSAYQTTATTDKNSGKFRGVCQVYAVFSHRQLGKTDDWLLEKIVSANVTGDDANRDFFNIWTSGTQSSPLPTHIAEQLARSTVDSDFQSIAATGGYMLRWYVPEDQVEQFMRTRKVVVGIDTSDASGGDDIGLVFVDAQTGGVVAAGNVNETNLITFSQWLIELLVQYDNLTMIIERRSSGVTILDYLLLFLPARGIDPFKRLFNWVVNDPHEYPQRHQEAMLPMPRRSEDTYVRAKTYFGFATSGGGATSRTALYSATLMNAAKRFATRVHDMTLTMQITGLVTKNGRVDHADGEHDDLVIGWLLCHWFLTMAKNLSYYGIDSNKTLVPVFSHSTATPAERANELRQTELRNRIEMLVAMMREETDPFIAQRFEQELRAREKELVLRDGETFSLDAVLKSINDSRGQRQRTAVANYGGDSIAQRYGYDIPIDASRLPSNYRLVN
jgi:hypothetical protein